MGGIVLVAALMLGPARPAVAQTPGEACAADSLYLISPEAIELSYDTSGKVGLTVSWPNLDLSQATCYSLSDTAGLGFGVAVTGGFGDRVDRVLRFSAPSNGGIGAAEAANLILDWRNEGPATYGNLGGRINLSNNGGLWQFTGNGSRWTQQNAGLPMTWLNMNFLALARGTGGYLLGAFSRDANLSGSVGLKEWNGSSWVTVAGEVFDSAVRVTCLAVSPTDNGTFLVGTRNRGLFVTRDGGETFTQWTTQFDPDFDHSQTNFGVQAVDWTGDRIFVYLNNYGLFASTDGGVSFNRSPILVPNNLNLPPGEQVMILPSVNRIHQNPADPDRALISLLFHGVYETTDGGASWSDLYGDLVVPDPENSSAWVTSATSAVYVQGSPDTIIMGVLQRGIYRTVNGGVSWNLVATEPGLQPENLANLSDIALVDMPGFPGYVIAQEDGHAILRTLDGGATWSEHPVQPVITRALDILPLESGSGSFLYPTYGGGIYVPDTPLRMSETYTAQTSPELRDLDLGLSIAFSPGFNTANRTFRLVCQTIQGWAVWRGPSHRPGEMTLLGLYDNVNPEDCFEGFCGDNSLEIVPNCFAAKRAACFDFSRSDTLRFFDQEVYNGFEYTYAVTTFDYGNTALTTPENNSNEMLFSPRFDGDIKENEGLSPFPGPGNAQEIQINIGPVNAVADEEIYAYPNPVRLGAGLPRDEGNSVVFTNIPEGSRIMVFTTAGDKVIELLPEGIQGRNMFWNTRNDSGEELAAGIYLYKVEMTQREEFWGRLVVIR